MTKIAIMSDIHFGKFARCMDFAVPGEAIQDQSDGDLPLKEGLIELMKQQNVDCIFIAGDLTSVGEPQEFWFCEQEIKSIAKEVGVDEKNIICCLGNHDIDRNISRIAEGKISDKMDTKVADIIKRKYNKLAAYSSVHCMNTLSHVFKDNQENLPCTGVFENRDLVVFVLNSGMFCSHDQEYSHGQISKEQLDWFERTTKKYRSKNKIKIVLLHHHPFNYAYPVLASDISTLEEGPELIDIATKHGINIVIHGHRHHPRVQTDIKESGNPITFICAGSLSVNSQHRSNGEIPNSVHFLEIDKERDYYILKNYQYTGTEGWKPMNYGETTPVDSVMKLGKLYSEEEREHSILKYKQLSENTYILNWEEIDEPLQYMKFHEVENKMKDLLKDDYNIFGNFPENIILVKKEKKQ